MKRLTQIWNSNFRDLNLKEFIVGIITLPLTCIYYIINWRKYNWKKL